MQCPGIGPTAAISEFDKVEELDEPALSSVAEAHREARSAARRRVEPILESTWSAPAGFPSSAGLHRSLTAAATRAVHDFVAHVPVDGGGWQPSKGTPREMPLADPSILDPELELHRIAALRGARTLSNAERWVPGLADLVDDLTLALHAPCQAWLVVGTADEAMLRADNRSIVIAVGAPVAVDTGDATEGHVTVEPGRSFVTTRLRGIRTERDKPAIVIKVTMPLVADISRIIARLGGHVPRMRADLPHDLLRPATAYGVESGVDSVDLLRQEIDKVFSEEFERRAMAWWAATLLPCTRDRPELSSLPAAVEDWTALTVIGTAPGGFGYFAPAEDGTWLAAAGRVIEVPTHLYRLFALVASGRTFQVDAVDSECPDSDPHCVRRAVDRLLWLGLVRISSTVDS